MNYWFWFPLLAAAGAGAPTALAPAPVAPAPAAPAPAASAQAAWEKALKHLSDFERPVTAVEMHGDKSFDIASVMEDKGDFGSKGKGWRTKITSFDYKGDVIKAVPGGKHQKFEAMHTFEYNSEKYTFIGADNERLGGSLTIVTHGSGDQKTLLLKTTDHTGFNDGISGMTVVDDEYLVLIHDAKTRGPSDLAGRNARRTTVIPLTDVFDALQPRTLRKGITTKKTPVQTFEGTSYIKKQTESGGKITVSIFDPTESTLLSEQEYDGLFPISRKPPKQSGDIPDDPEAIVPLSEVKEGVKSFIIAHDRGKLTYLQITDIGLDAEEHTYNYLGDLTWSSDTANGVKDVHDVEALQLVDDNVFGYDRTTGKSSNNYPFMSDLRAILEKAADG